MDGEFWEHLLHKATELVDAGEYQQAVETLDQVARSEHPDAAPRAAGLMGQLMRSFGDTESARMMFRYAVSADHPVASGRAALELGELLQDEQDVIGAFEAYEKATESADVEVSTTAKVAIEKMHEEFEVYVASLSVARAEHERARRYDAIDEPDSAKAAYHASIESEDPEYAPRSAIALALMLAREQDPIPHEARALLQRAVDSEHPEHAPMAAGLLGEFLSEHDPDAAVDMLRVAGSSETSWLAETATARLAELLVTLQRYPEAIERFASVMATAEAETSAHAAFRIGVLLDALTDAAATAQACFRYAADFGTADIAGNARELAQQVTENRGVPEHPAPVTPAEIRDLLAEVVAEPSRPGTQDSDHTAASTTADSSAGTDDAAEAVDTRSLDEIRTWAEQAAEDELHAYCDRTIRLGLESYGNGDTARAVRILEQVMATGEATFAPGATARIAIEFYTHHGVRGAESAMSRLTELGHEKLIPRAWFNLAKQLMLTRQVEESERILRRIIDDAGADEPVGHVAHCALTVLRDDRDAIAPALRAVQQHDEGGLAVEVLDLVYQFSQEKTKQAIEAYDTMATVAKTAGEDDAADTAKSHRETLQSMMPS